MKVILISQENEFNKEHVLKIQKIAPFKWIRQERTDLLKIPELFNQEEKIIALSPVPIGWEIPSIIYDKLRNVKAICLVTTAYDFLDLQKVRKLNTLVTNVPYYSSDAVAEYAFFMFMALLKRFPCQLKSGFKYEFTDINLMDEFGKKTAGIIGLGHVGERIAKITKSLGFEVIYWSRRKKSGELKFVSLERLIRQSDVVFPTFALNEQTKDLLRKEVLMNLKNSVYFINIIGENACDTNYLLERVESGRLQGLAFESDKRKMKDYKGNVFITAPLAWYTKQSLERNIDIWTDTIISCVKGRPINLIDENL